MRTAAGAGTVGLLPDLPSAGALFSQVASTRLWQDVDTPLDTKRKPALILH